MDALAELHGLEVSAVCFVRDYVELRFDGPVLRLLAAPRIDAPDGSWQVPAPGSRDALCRLIGATVRRASEEDAALVLGFDTEYVLAVPKDDRTAGPEIAHLVPWRDGRLDVSRMVIWESDGSSGDD